MDVVTAVLFVLGFLTVYLLFERFIERPGAEKQGRTRSTKIVPTLYMDQLDKRTNASAKQFELNDSVMCGEYGYIICGSGCEHIPPTGLKLSAACPEAEYVDEGHAVVYKDGSNYYIESKRGINGMRLSGCEDLIDKVRIENGMVVYLGPQPVQFLFVDNKYTWRVDSRNSADNEPHIRRKPKRRNKPGTVQ